MNGLKVLKPESIGLDYKTHLYCIILSDCVKQAPDVISNYSVRDLLDTFDETEDFDVANLLKELIKEKKVKINSGTIIIGATDGKRVSLLCDNVMDLTSEFSLINDKLSKYTRTLGKGIAQHLAARVDVLLKKDVGLYSISDFISLFSLCYEVSYQEKPRSFTGKEVGVLKNLSKNYKGSHLFRMIVHYIFYYEQYFKSGVASISGLAYKKDVVYGNIRSIVAKKPIIEDIEHQTKF